MGGQRRYIWPLVAMGIVAGGLFYIGLDQLSYYGHLARGQARVVLQSQPIDALLADAALDTTWHRQFLFINAVRAFARDRLGLTLSSNYTRFYHTHGQPISWNVSASQATRLEAYQWHFPIVGSVPYKGFFDQSRARAEYDRLKAQGLDVILRPVSAYSTLGFFSDPVLSTMLAYSPARLADLILHELTHATVYIKGQTDYNESLATFIGETGSLLFLAEHFGIDTPLIPAARRQRADEQRFRRFMVGVVARFDSLYGLALPDAQVRVQRVTLMEAAKASFRAIQSHFYTHAYDDFLEWEVNNARLLSYKRYNRNLEDFAAVYRRKQQRLDQALAVFIACGQASDPWVCVADSGRGSSPHLDTEVRH